MGRPWRRSYRPKRYTKSQIEKSKEVAKAISESINYHKEKFLELSLRERRGDAEEEKSGTTGEQEDSGIHKDDAQSGCDSGNETA